MIVFVHNLITKDFWLKLLSLALAILIWLTVKVNTNGETPTSPWLALLGRAADETVMTVPVRVPTGEKYSFSISPDQVTVTLHGDPKLLKSLREDDVDAEVDLTGIESANGLVRRVEIVLPPSISYTRVQPATVEVTVAPKTQ
ncbi:MAG TPA: CdaR family protein [Candidatus Angelobacter sp.]|nr:CdaR family protein [Candidatus Angelobacter sp.]